MLFPCQLLAALVAPKGIGQYIRQHFLDKTFQGLYHTDLFDRALLVPYFIVLILLAGLRSLPTEPMEAASIDGASRRQAFWHVTLPLLRPYLLVALLLRTIFEFRAFDNIYAMTGGGPANSTMVLSMFTYLVSFVRFDFGLGAAASWLMLLMR